MNGSVILDILEGVWKCPKQAVTPLPLPTVERKYMRKKGKMRHLSLLSSLIPHPIIEVCAPVVVEHTLNPLVVGGIRRSDRASKDPPVQLV